MVESLEQICHVCEGRSRFLSVRFRSGCECTLSPWLLNLWPLGDFGSKSKILVVKFINIQNIRLGTHCEIAVR